MQFLGPNMALGKFAMQGNGTYKTFTADKAIDNNTSNTASSGACAHTTHSSHSWWKVNLGRPYLLTGIKIYNRERGGEFFPSFMLNFTGINVLNKLIKCILCRKSLVHLSQKKLRLDTSHN